MKNPDPNPVAILTKLLKLQRGDVASMPGLHSLVRIIHPVIFYDDASGTFHYTVAGTGTDYTADYVTDASFIRINGIQLKTKSTTPAVNDFVKAEMLLPLGPGPIIRLQLMFKRPPATSSDFSTLVMLYSDDETRRLDASIEAHWQNQRLAYLRKTNGTWEMTEVEDWHLERDNNRWHHLDVAMNLVAGTYQHIKLNGKVCTPDPADLQPTGTAGRGRILDFRIQNTALAAEQAETHFDQVLITTEEA